VHCLCQPETQPPVIQVLLNCTMVMEYRRIGHLRLGDTVLEQYRVQIGLANRHIRQFDALRQVDNQSLTVGLWFDRAQAAQCCRRVRQWGYGSRVDWWELYSVLIIHFFQLWRALTAALVVFTFPLKSTLSTPNSCATVMPSAAASWAIIFVLFYGLAQLWNLVR
jgi:hypothetical protein